MSAPGAARHSNHAPTPELGSEYYPPASPAKPHFTSREAYFLESVRHRRTDDLGWLSPAHTPVIRLYCLLSQEARRSEVIGGD